MAGPLTLENDHMSVRVHPRGAALIGVRFRGRDENLVLGFRDPEDHHRIPACAGHIVGPIANRLAGGEIEIDGRSYQMPRNENGMTTLHSGPDGLHTREWEVVAHRGDVLELSCTLPDGACGLPGVRVITARYALEGSALVLALRATTDAPTAMNLAAHPYWTLDGLGRVDSHRLHLNTAQYLPTDAANLPTGQIAPVAGTVFDFTVPRAVPHDPALDVNYCLPQDGALRTAAQLTSATGITLTLQTTAPGLQVYNGSNLPRMADVLDRPGALRPFGAIALEPQHWPDAPHHTGFPSIALHPGAVYQQTTRYALHHAPTGRQDIT